MSEKTIVCEACKERGSNAGFIIVGMPDGEARRFGPLCFRCLDYARRRMIATARPDPHDEIKVMGEGH